MQGLAAVSDVRMGGFIPGLSQTVKKLADLSTCYACTPELVQNAQERLAFIACNTGIRSTMLGQKLTKLSQLDECGVGIIKHISLSQRGVLDQDIIVPGKKAEVW